LRYRLYEIDRIINRTLVYGLLTVLLGLGYAVGSLLFVLVAGAGADPPSWLVAAATLAATMVFRPARRRIQAVVDRRFNRSRYNAAQTIQAFSTASATKSTWTRSRPSWWPWPAGLWSQPWSRSGCDRPPSAPPALRLDAYQAVAETVCAGDPGLCRLVAGEP
jgi:hypothetical protein